MKIKASELKMIIKEEVDRYKKLSELNEKKSAIEKKLKSINENDECVECDQMENKQEVDESAILSEDIVGSLFGADMVYIMGEPVSRWLVTTIFATLAAMGTGGVAWILNYMKKLGIQKTKLFEYIKSGKIDKAKAKAMLDKVSKGESIGEELGKVEDTAQLGGI